MSQPRRIVTGHDASGKSVVLSDAPAPKTIDVEGPDRARQRYCLAEWEQAVKIDPKYADAWVKLGLVPDAICDIPQQRDHTMEDFGRPVL